MQTVLARAGDNARLSALKAALIAAVGPDGVRDDAETLALYSEDVWSASPHRVRLVVSPRSLRAGRRRRHLAPGRGHELHQRLYPGDR